MSHPRTAERSTVEPLPVENAKWINLGNGRFALVDEQDFEKINAFLWHYNSGYAARRITIATNKRALLYMHRLVVGEAAIGLQVDHINRNRLDNRRGNLRVVTREVNQLNRRFYDDGEAGVRFMRDNQRKKRWRAMLHHSGRSISLGVYLTKEEAVAAYKKAADEARGPGWEALCRVSVSGERPRMSANDTERKNRRRKLPSRNA